MCMLPEKAFFLPNQDQKVILRHSIMTLWHPNEKSEKIEFENTIWSQ